MKWPRKRWIILLILLVVGIAAYAVFHEAPPDPRYNGAYGIWDGRIALVTARPSGSLRLTRLDGESWMLRPDGKNNFEGSPGWNGKAPVEFEAEFDKPEVSAAEESEAPIRYSRGYSRHPAV